MNSDYKIRTGEKFKYVLIPMFDNEQFYLYGVSTNLTSCETKNAIIEIISEYTVNLAEGISDLVLNSYVLSTERRKYFNCTISFVCSLGLDGKPKKYDKYYCYEWFDVDTGYVFYVGKGIRNRWKQIENGRRNEDFIKYYNTHNCSCRFIKLDMTEEDAYIVENERLKYLHGINQAHCNHDDGGRCGATNYGCYNGMYHNTHSEEVKKKLSSVNKICQQRSKNGNAKPVYVYDNNMVFLKEYGCVPDAIEDLFGSDEIASLQGKIYYSMKNANNSVKGYYFSREKII